MLLFKTILLGFLVSYLWKEALSIPLPKPLILPTGVKRISLQRIGPAKAMQWCDADTEQLPKVYVEASEGLKQENVFEDSNILLQFSTNNLTLPSPWWAECTFYRNGSSVGKMCAIGKGGNILRTDFAYGICCWKDENCPSDMKPILNHVITEDTRNGDSVADFFRSFHSIAAVTISCGFLCQIRVMWMLGKKRTLVELAIESLILVSILISLCLAAFSAMYFSMETVLEVARTILLQYFLSSSSQLGLLLAAIIQIFQIQLEKYIFPLRSRGTDANFGWNRVCLFISVITLIIPCGLAWGLVSRYWSPPYLDRFAHLANWTLFRSDEAFLM